MKTSFLLLLMLTFSFIGKAQLKAKEVCGSFMVDLLDGNINGIRPDFHPDRIKLKLPCFTSSENEGPQAKCGGTISYKDRDIYFYTQRDYVVIGSKFKGKLSLPLMGAKRSSLYKRFGHPKVKDTDWEAYQTQYGCMVLYFTKANIINKIIFSTKGTDALQLCQ